MAQNGHNYFGIFSYDFPMIFLILMFRGVGSTSYSERPFGDEVCLNGQFQRLASPFKRPSLLEEKVNHRKIIGNDTEIIMAFLGFFIVKLYLNHILNILIDFVRFSLV